jgi:hypothetical protein
MLKPKFLAKIVCGLLLAVIVMSAGVAVLSLNVAIIAYERALPAENDAAKPADNLPAEDGKLTVWQAYQKAEQAVIDYLGADFKNTDISTFWQINTDRLLFLRVERDSSGNVYAVIEREIRKPIEYPNTHFSSYFGVYFSDWKVVPFDYDELLPEREKINVENPNLPKLYTGDDAVKALREYLGNTAAISENENTSFNLDSFAGYSYPDEKPYFLIITSVRSGENWETLINYYVSCENLSIKQLPETYTYEEWLDVFSDDLA